MEATAWAIDGTVNWANREEGRVARSGTCGLSATGAGATAAALVEAAGLVALADTGAAAPLAARLPAGADLAAACTASAALVAALVIGFFNAVLRPILIVLTLPVTVITLGLFLFVINALMFWSAAGVLDGFHVSGFGAALLGSLIYSVLGVIIDSALQRLFPR